MAAASSPTVRARELGRRLKELRESKGATLADVAEELSCSQAKVSRMETGQRPVQALDIKVLCRYYGVSEDDQQTLVALAAESRKRGWWQDIDHLDDVSKTFLGLETAASEVFAVEAIRIPGLLQTTEYTIAWLSQVRPPSWWQEKSLEKVVELRLRRQSRLMDGSLKLHALIDERALLPTSDSFRDTLIAQIERLLESSLLPSIEIRIVPLSVGPHAGLDGSFSLLHFGGGALTDVVAVESHYSFELLEKVGLVQRYREIYDLVSESALTAENTRTWLRHQQERLATVPELTEINY